MIKQIINLAIFAGVIAGCYYIYIKDMIPLAIAIIGILFLLFLFIKLITQKE